MRLPRPGHPGGCDFSRAMQRREGRKEACVLAGFWVLAQRAVRKNQAIAALAPPTMSLQYQLKGGAYNLYDCPRRLV